MQKQKSAAKRLVNAVLRMVEIGAADSAIVSCVKDGLRDANYDVFPARAKFMTELEQLSKTIDARYAVQIQRRRSDARSQYTESVIGHVVTAAYSNFVVVMVEKKWHVLRDGTEDVTEQMFPKK